MFSEIILGLIAILVENCTGVLIFRKTNRPAEPVDEETGLVQFSVQDELKDFTNFDKNDAIFREFDPPVNEETDPKAWRKNLPPLKQSMFKSLKFVFMIQTICGTLIGLFAIFLVFIDFNTSYVCIINQVKYNQLPKRTRAIERLGQSVEGFFIEFYDFLLLFSIFSWSQLNQLNLILINVVAAFLDVTYEMSMSLFGLYDEHWISYPLNVLFTSVSVINGVVLAKFYTPRPYKWTSILKLAFTFSAQFVLGMSYVVFLCYRFWPWYNKQHESTKVVFVAMSSLITFLPKLVCRLAAQKLKVIHPGSSHVFVCVMYGTFAIVYRVMQAELSSFTSFVALGIFHSFVDLIERLTITMRDYIWEYIYLLLCCRRKPNYKYRSPRSRRFVADMSIQKLLQESTGLVIGLGFTHLYHFMYSDTKPPYTDYGVLVGFAIRVITGLAIDLVFNTISVVIQIRVMNIAIMKVWKHKWRHHCVVTIIVAMETVFFFTGYMFTIVRHKYNYETHSLVRYAWNCTAPFAEL